ncbi:MAG TPA: hypothetical protein VGN57_23265 [Pirellulaceae bacterium]|jgi:hypothetical protein|nr:hypothetical protein [Pirellulaceae bacterium]
MLRFFVRRIPRFGFVTLFAAMLLFVSVAGWAKRHLDLWREEEALLEDLAKAGVGVTYKRGWAEYVETKPKPGAPPPTVSFWSPIVPFVSRIESLHFDDPSPVALLERAAALPYVEQVGGEVGPLTGAAMPLQAIAVKAGLEFPPLTRPTLPTSVEPLASGSPMSDDEAERALDLLSRQRRVRQSAPTRGIAHDVHAVPSSLRRFYARDDKVRFAAFDGAFVTTTRKSHDAFVFRGTGCEQSMRLDDPELAEEMFARENPRLIMFDERRCIEQNLERYGIQSQFFEALDVPSEIRVERIDERRVRFDLPPIVQKFPAADCEDSVQISLVARTDLDWALEGWDMRASRTTGPATPANLPPIASASYRGTLRREGEWVVGEEWVADWLAGPATPVVPGFPTHLVADRHAGVARYDFSPNLDLSHVTPELFDARMLPPRRELPWLRWYRVTFGLSLALLGWVAFRRLAARKLPAGVAPA